MNKKIRLFRAICDELTAAQRAVGLCRANLDSAALSANELEWLKRKVDRYINELKEFRSDLIVDEMLKS